MITVQDRGDGCAVCIDGRVDVEIHGEVVATTICDCKLDGQVEY